MHVDYCTNKRMDVSALVSRIRWNFSQILGAAATIADDARQAAGHRFVDNESPGFVVVARQNQNIRRHVGSRDLGLVQKAGERSRRLRSRGHRSDVRGLQRNCVSVEHYAAFFAQFRAELTRTRKEKANFQ